MSQMLINYEPGEVCRVAMLNAGKLEELHAERIGNTTIVGNIYAGKVVSVEQSIQAAFVDFGIGANGFLHVSDLHPQYFPGQAKSSTERIGHKTPRYERPPIQHCLKPGQRIVVQVIKEGINTKGPTLTSYLSIPGRYLVLLPQMDKVGVSRKVEDEDERKELRKLLDGLEVPKGFGLIARTAGIGKSKTEIKRDLAFLQRLWKDLEASLNRGGGARLLYAESDLLMRALRDMWTSDISEIVIDHPVALRRAASFMKIVSPRSTTKLLQYDRPLPLYHAFDVERQIEQTHARQVPLTSGGYLVIDENEAMISIDVNSGRSRGAADAESNAFKTNMEAVDEICRQLRLRDIGGLVLCDLIDMGKPKNRRDIEARFRDNFKRDRAATRFLPVSDFGIVEITRQRVRGSLRSMHYAPCPHCAGRGHLRKPDSVADDAIRLLASTLALDKVAKVELAVSARVAGQLLSTKRLALSRLERVSGKRVDTRISDHVAADFLSVNAYDEKGADIDLTRLPTIKPPANLHEWHEVDEGVEEEAARLEVEVEAEQHEEAEKDARLTLRRQAASDTRTPARAESDDESDAEGGKRRRRRRSGRGRSGEDREQTAAPQADDTPRERPQRAPSRSTPAPTRGDSWDITPAELPAAFAASVSDDDAPPARTRAVEPRSRRAEHEPRAPKAEAPDHDGDDHEADDDTAVSVEHQPSDRVEGEDGDGKRRRRRRGRRGGAGRRRPEGAAPNETANTEAPRESAREPREPRGDAPRDSAPAPRQERRRQADSWDVTPAELPNAMRNGDARVNDGEAAPDAPRNKPERPAREGRRDARPPRDDNRRPAPREQSERRPQQPAPAPQPRSVREQTAPAPTVETEAMPRVGKRRVKLAPASALLGNVQDASAS